MKTAGTVKFRHQGSQEEGQNVETRLGRRPETSLAVFCDEMWCYVMLHLYYTIICHTISQHIKLYRIILYHVILHYIVLYYITLYHILLYYSILCCFYSVLNDIKLCYIVVWYSIVY